MSHDPLQPANQALDQLLRRPDIWRGHAHHFSAGGTAGASTGYAELDGALLHRGWPYGALTEICQATYQAEFTLLSPGILLSPGYVVLLNPPSQPFVHALIQRGIDLDRLVVVEAASRSEFLGCYTELARASSCSTVVGWQPREAMTYTDVRRCALAVDGSNGLYWLVRPSTVQQQSSPAGLRLFSKLTPDGLEVTVFKQKGWLKQSGRPIVLPLPAEWREFTRPGSFEVEQPSAAARIAQGSAERTP
jgi:hypothetical protein